MWEKFGVSKKKRFCETYGDIASLILVLVEEPLLRAAMRFWDPSYKCFTFGKNDLVPTVEEYSVLKVKPQTINGMFYHGMFYKISFESIYMMNMVWWLSL